MTDPAVHPLKGIAGDALAEAGELIDPDPDAGAQLTMCPRRPARN